MTVDNAPLAAQWAVKFFKAYLDDLVETTPWFATVNDLRVLCTVIHAEMFDEPIGVNELSEQLDIPRATVSRIVANMIALRVFKEGPHENGRRHPLSLTVTARERTAEWGQRIANAATKSALECCGGIPELIEELYEMFPTVTEQRN